MKLNDISVIYLWIFGTNRKLTEQINDFGIQIIFVFFVFIFVLLIAPKIQSLNLFIFLKESLKVQIVVVGICIQLLGVFMAYYYFTSDEKFLLSLVGTILIVGGGSVIFWARETQKDKYELYSKLIITSTSFVVALLWLFFYGREMLNL